MRDDLPLRRIDIEFYIKDDCSLEYKSSKNFDGLDVELSEDVKIQLVFQPNHIRIRDVLCIKCPSESYKANGRNILKMSYIETNK